MTIRYRLAIILLCTLLLTSSSTSNRQNGTVYIPPVEVNVVKRKPLDHREVRCLALNIYHEARGEGEKGKLAVAHVTINRTKHHDYPENICNVVYQKGQFSWYSDGKSDWPKDKTQWENCLHLAATTLLGMSKDPTRGATHYYNPRKSRPSWRNRFPTVAHLGNHIFLKDT